MLLSFLLVCMSYVARVFTHYSLLMRLYLESLCMYVCMLSVVTSVCVHFSLLTINRYPYDVICMLVV